MWKNVRVRMNGAELGAFANKKELEAGRDDARIELGECKWVTLRSAAAVRSELARKLQVFPNPKGSTLHRRYFVRNLPPRLRPEGDETWHDLTSLRRMAKLTNIDEASRLPKSLLHDFAALYKCLSSPRHPQSSLQQCRDVYVTRAKRQQDQMKPCRTRCRGNV